MLRRVGFVALLVALYSSSIFTTNGCANITGPPQVETFLSGIVTDAATGAPIAGADVSIQSVGDTTDASGSYTVGLLSPRTERLVVSRSGYRTYEATITLREGGNRRNVQLDRL
jgi:hypothetical protein